MGLLSIGQMSNKSRCVCSILQEFFEKFPTSCWVLKASCRIILVFYIFAKLTTQRNPNFREKSKKVRAAGLSKYQAKETTEKFEHKRQILKGNLDFSCFANGVFASFSRFYFGTEFLKTRNNQENLETAHFSFLSCWKTYGKTHQSQNAGTIWVMPYNNFSLKTNLFYSFFQHIYFDWT